MHEKVGRLIEKVDEFLEKKLDKFDLFLEKYEETIACIFALIIISSVLYRLYSYAG
jgi:hypothetical protein